MPPIQRACRALEYLDAVDVLHVAKRVVAVVTEAVAQAVAFAESADIEEGSAVAAVARLGVYAAHVIRYLVDARHAPILQHLGGHDLNRCRVILEWCVGSGRADRRFGAIDGARRGAHGDGRQNRHRRGWSGVRCVLPAVRCRVAARIRRRGDCKGRDGRDRAA